MEERKSAPEMSWDRGNFAHCKEVWRDGVLGKKQGLLHREDGPAIVGPYGQTCWYLNGKKHRIGAPAYESRGGNEMWWVDGKLHREDGPAYTGITPSFGNSPVTREWWVNGVIHRTDGPAVLYGNGDFQWWQNGVRHRDGGPAYKDARREAWFQNGVLHREDGPAVIWSYNWVEFHLNGKQLPTHIQNMDQFRHYILSQVMEF